MEIEGYPQFQLYLLTLNLLMLKDQIVPKNCDEWCVNATIINRAYYSSYLYCLLWLKKIKRFEPKPPWTFEKKEKRIGEHKQVRDALYDFGEEDIKKELSDLASLRKRLITNLFMILVQKKSMMRLNIWKEYSDNLNSNSYFFLNILKITKWF